MSRSSMSQPVKCPICQSNSATIFLKRERVPIHQNLVINDKRSALEIPRGNLNLAVCVECDFIFNQAFEPSTLRYGQDYDNTQYCSGVFADYLSYLVNYLIFEKSVQNRRVIEVGCGKGLLLRKLTELGGNIGYGFDPSYVGPATDLDGHIYFEKRYYDPECAVIPADVIVCRHVIEHVPNPMDLLHTIRLALVNYPQSMVFFETPCVEWILRNHVTWDFFYEHCSYFTSTSLATALEISGFRVDNVRSVFGDQYLWLEATPLPSGDKLTISKRPGSIYKLATSFASSESELIKVWENRIEELAGEGGIAIWGAGAKGVTLANLIDPECKWIACVVDLNPNKQGHYIPGTGHPIIGYKELAKYGVKTAILMNPNYRQENLTLLRESDFNIDLIDLMNIN